MNEEEDYEIFDDPSTAICPHCMGIGTVSCHCGGDQCYCENHGEAPCPVCWEEGEVTHERHDAYMDNLAKRNAEMARVWAEIEKESKE